MQGCQANADQLFVLALAVPAVVAVLAFVWISRAPLREASSEPQQQVFQDPETGNFFRGETPPERDRKGELAWRAVSYTPWPVETGSEGDRVRVEVGPVGARQTRTFVFERKLRQPSKIFTITLERPMGVMFQEDKRRQLATVDDLVEGSRAAQKAKIAKFDSAARANAALPGDLLRGCTCTTISYPTTSLVLGAKPPLRYIVLYGADDQKWERIATALKRGLVQDGPVTLVLEREMPRDDAREGTVDQLFSQKA